MESYEVNGSAELACMALSTKKWGSSSLATTNANLEEIESGFETREIRKTQEPANASDHPLVSLEAAGPLVGETSYMMPVSEWILYLPTVGQKSFLCLLPDLSSQMEGESYVIYWSKGTTRSIYCAQNDALLVSPSQPYENQFGEEISSFFFRHNVSSYLDVATQLIRKHFPDVKKIDLQLERDPDTLDEWITIDLETAEQIEEVLQRYDRYTEEWIALVPWPERERIRLSYNLTQVSHPNS